MDKFNLVMFLGTSDTTILILSLLSGTIGWGVNYIFTNKKACIKTVLGNMLFLLLFIRYTPQLLVFLPEQIRGHEHITMSFVSALAGIFIDQIIKKIIKIKIFENGQP